MAAKVVFFSSGFLEASPETLGFSWNAKNGGQGGLLSGGFVEASPETAEFLKVSS
jgi:hypothetical protein